MPDIHFYSVIGTSTLSLVFVFHILSRHIVKLKKRVELLESGREHLLSQCDTMKDLVVASNDTIVAMSKDLGAMQNRLLKLEPSINDGDLDLP